MDLMQKLWGKVPG